METQPGDDQVFSPEKTNIRFLDIVSGALINDYTHKAGAMEFSIGLSLKTGSVRFGDADSWSSWLMLSREK